MGLGEAEKDFPQKFFFATPNTNPYEEQSKIKKEAAVKLPLIPLIKP